MSAESRSLPRAVVALVCAVAMVTSALPVWGAGQTVPGQSAVKGKQLIAVLDLEAVGATKVEASAMTDRLREELLKTGRFTLVDRSQMNAILNEQALQQTGCTSSECAVQVGQILGVQKIVSGKVTQIDKNLWLLSGSLIDVETAQTLAAESVQYQGPFTGLLSSGIKLLAAKLTGETPPVENMVKSAPEAAPATPAQTPKSKEGAQAESESGMPWWGWALIGVGVVGLAAAAGGKKSSGSSGGGSCASAGSCGTVTVTW